MEDVAPHMDFKLSGPDLDSHFTLECPDSRVGDAMRYTFCDGSGKYKVFWVIGTEKTFYFSLI
jgi:hypothetical protein